jgi:hypothetical protein
MGESMPHFAIGRLGRAGDDADPDRARRADEVIDSKPIHCGAK